MEPRGSSVPEPPHALAHWSAPSEVKTTSAESIPPTGDALNVSAPGSRSMAESKYTTTATSPSSDDILMCCTFSRPVPPQVFTHWKLPLESNFDRNPSLNPPAEVALVVAAPGSKSTVLPKRPPAYTLPTLSIAKERP